MRISLVIPFPLFILTILPVLLSLMFVCLNCNLYIQNPLKTSENCFP